MRKSFGGKAVLDGIDLETGAGTTFSLLGPNGAGKTTTVQIMSTLAHADGGEARVAGHDVARDPAAVRAAIGVTGPLLTAYGVTDDATCEALVQLAREARRRGWWTRYTDVLGSGTYVGLEAEAASLHTYESMFIPGLLQTEDYARAVIRAGLTRPDPEILERRLAAGMARQEILSRPDPPEIWAILDESVISRPVGSPAVMRAQLQHLIDASNQPNTPLTLQALPLATGAHPGMNGPFVILDFHSPNDPAMVYLETATVGLYIDRI